MLQYNFFFLIFFRDFCVALGFSLPLVCYIRYVCNNNIDDAEYTERHFTTCSLSRYFYP